MTKFKIIAFYIAILFVMGCGSKKKVYEKVITKDSISYVLPYKNTLVIDNLCDTLKSPLNVVSGASTGVSSVDVEIKNNKLTIVTRHDTIFKEKIVFKDRVKLEVKEVSYVPKWIKTLLWATISLILTFIAFPKIPKAIKTIIYKIIGFPV